MNKRMVWMALVMGILLSGVCGTPKMDSKAANLSGDSTIVAKVNEGTAKEYKEKKRKANGKWMCFDFEVMKNGNLVNYVADKRHVWDGKKWETKPLSNIRRFMKKKKLNDFSMCGYTANGILYYCSDKGVVYEVTDKGKVLYQYDLKKEVEWKEGDKVKDCISLGGHKVLIYLERGYYSEDKTSTNNKSQLYRIHLKKGKVELEYEGIAGAPSLVGGGKMYFLPNTYADGQNKDVITIRDLKTGKLLKTIDASALRAKVPQREEFIRLEGGETAYEPTLEGRSLKLGEYQGKLYAAYITGIYVWDEKKGAWNLVVDAHKNNFALKKMGITCFKVGKKGRFYLLGLRMGEDDNTANMFYEYGRKKPYRRRNGSLMKKKGMGINKA